MYLKFAVRIPKSIQHYCKTLTFRGSIYYIILVALSFGIFACWTT